MSRRHARIERRGGHYVVFDTDSRNGVVLNGVEISSEARLQHGDLIELSDEQIRIELGRDDLAPRATEVMPHRPAARPSKAEYGASDEDNKQDASGFDGPLGLKTAADMLAALDPSPQPSEPAASSTRPQITHAPPSTVPTQVQSTPPLAAAGPRTLPSEEFQPLGVPSEEASPASQIPSTEGPYLENVAPSATDPKDSAFPAAADPALPPQRRGSLLMALIGVFVGFVLALSIVAVGDHIFNHGGLRTTLTDRLNVLLAPYDLRLPVFDPSSNDGSPAPGIASMDAGSDTASAQPKQPREDAGSPQQAGVATPARTPFVFKASSTLLVDTVFVKPGDAVTTQSKVLLVMTGDRKWLVQKSKLEKTKTKLVQRSKKRGRKGKKARKELRVLKKKLGRVLKRLDRQTMTAPQAGLIRNVQATKGQLVEKGAALLTIGPRKAP